MQNFESVSLSILYIVATPIGNLEDVSTRAIQTLRSVDLIASEDTRVTRKLLSHYDIKTRTISFNRVNAKQRIPTLLKHLESLNLALTSDAGTPGISDPGHELIAAIDQTVTQVIPIPGPSALTAVLSAAPFPTDRFYFNGFAPRKEVEIDQMINIGRTLSVPIAMFESPRRIIALLTSLERKIPDTNIFIMREITKKFEDSFYGTPAAAKNYFLEPRGEFTIVVAPISEAPSTLDHDAIERLVHSLEDSGLKPREIAKSISSITRMSNSEAYKMIVELKPEARDED